MPLVGVVFGACSGGRVGITRTGKFVIGASLASTGVGAGMKACCSDALSFSAARTLGVLPPLSRVSGSAPERRRRSITRICLDSRSVLDSPRASQNRLTAWCSGVNPRRLRADVPAPAASSASTQGVWLWKLASCSAVFPFRSVASICAPCFRSRLTSARLPRREAVINGVAPSAFRASISAPRSSRISTLAGEPSVNAVWRANWDGVLLNGVVPSSCGRASPNGRHPRVRSRVAQAMPVLWCKRNTGPSRDGSC